MSVDEKDREKVETEIETCQARVIQTLVPTILALGLISIADPQSIRNVTMGCAFAVLFSSSLYVASLSYKIFLNASFLQVFGRTDIKKNKIYWEDALSEYRKKHLPMIIHSETTTAAAIYMVLSFMFFFIFHKVNLIASFVAAAVLLFNSICIFLVYKRRHKCLKKWQDVKSILEKA